MRTQNYSVVLSGKKDLIQTDFEYVISKAYNLEESRGFLIKRTDGAVNFTLPINVGTSELAYLIFIVPGIIQKTVINILTLDYTLNAVTNTLRIPFNKFVAIDWPLPVGATLNNLSIQTSSLETIKIVMKAVYIDPNS